MQVNTQLTILQQITASPNASSEETLSQVEQTLETLGPMILSASAEDRMRICASFKATKLWASQAHSGVQRIGIRTLTMSEDSLTSFICLAVDQNDHELLEALRPQFIHQAADLLPVALRAGHIHGAEFLFQQIPQDQLHTLGGLQQARININLERSFTHLVGRSPIPIEDLRKLIPMVKLYSNVAESASMKRLLLQLPAPTCIEFFAAIGKAHAPFVIAAYEGVRPFKKLLDGLIESGMPEQALHRLLKQTNEKGDCILHTLNDLVITELLKVAPTVKKQLLHAVNNSGETALGKAIQLNLTEDAVFLLETSDHHALAQAFRDRTNVTTTQAVEDLIVESIRTAASPADLAAWIQTLPPGFLIGTFRLIPHVVKMTLPIADQIMPRLRTITRHDPLFERTMQYFFHAPKSAPMANRFAFAELLAKEPNVIEPAQLKSAIADEIASPESRLRLLTKLRAEYDASKIQELINLADKLLLNETQKAQFKALLPTEPQDTLWCQHPDYLALQAGLDDLQNHLNEALRRQDQQIYDSSFAQLSLATIAEFNLTRAQLDELFRFKVLLSIPLQLNQISPTFVPDFANLQNLRTMNSPQWQSYLMTRAQQSTTVKSKRLGEGDVPETQWLQMERFVADRAAAHEPMTSQDLRHFVRTVHLGLCQNLNNNDGVAGEYRNIEVRSGSYKSYLSKQFVKQEMDDFTHWLARSLQACDRNPTNLPLIMATAVKTLQTLISIHPFSDGNGRISRLMMDYVLQRYGLPPPLMTKISIAVFPELSVSLNTTPNEVLEWMWEGVQRSYQHLRGHA